MHGVVFTGSLLGQVENLFIVSVGFIIWEELISNILCKLLVPIGYKQTRHQTDQMLNELGAKQITSH